jgi:sterol desaturase/sphingolipid hydroxylase (fatty acid hydroxylase superfamily)
LIPTFLGLILCRVHVVTGAIWLFYRIGETVESHSGYIFPWTPFQLPWGIGARGHDYHHSHNKGVYGMFMFWDRIMGTDAEFRAYTKQEDEAAKKKAQ